MFPSAHLHARRMGVHRACRWADESDSTAADESMNGLPRPITGAMIHFTWSGGAALGSLLDIQGGWVRAVIHRWRSDRFRLLICTYDAPPCGTSVPVDEFTESRKTPKVTFYATPSSFVSQASTTSTACMTGSTRRTQRSPCSPPRRRPSTRTATSTPSRTGAALLVVFGWVS